MLLQKLRSAQQKRGAVQPAQSGVRPVADVQHGTLEEVPGAGARLEVPCGGHLGGWWMLAARGHVEAPVSWWGGDVQCLYVARSLHGEQRHGDTQ